MTKKCAIIEINTLVLYLLREELDILPEAGQLDLGCEGKKLITLVLTKTKLFK